MAKGIYIGVGETAKKAKPYIGVGGVAKKVKKVYVGVNGVPKLVWQSGLYTNSLVHGKTTTEEYITACRHMPRNVLPINDNKFVELFSDSTDYYYDACIRVGTYVNGAVTYGATHVISNSRYDNSWNQPYPNNHFAYALYDNKPNKMYLLPNGNIAIICITSGYDLYQNYSAVVHYFEYSINGTTFTYVKAKGFYDNELYGYSDVTYNVKTNQIYALTNNHGSYHNPWGTYLRQFDVGSSGSTYSYETFLFQVKGGDYYTAPYYTSTVGFNKDGTRLIAVRQRLAVTKYDTISLYSIASSVVSRIKEIDISIDLEGSIPLLMPMAMSHLSNEHTLFHAKGGLRVVNYSNDNITYSQQGVVASFSSAYATWGHLAGKMVDENVYFCGSNGYNGSNNYPFIRVEGLAVEVLPVRAPFNFGYTIGFQLSNDLVWINTVLNTTENLGVIKTMQTQFA